ncbi:hypothetical protein DPEC_G00208340 [Dallia pectoralis]|uniref:Uncharacterized protein n=1 Tax=Dallia pectoralis TaxID=75939 RepID=A0ACC2G594_DALPE|nr:hypothetical protein DPEC_G00208340 [Dallia pectoralis]
MLAPKGSTEPQNGSCKLDPAATNKLGLATGQVRADEIESHKKAKQEPVSLRSRRSGKLDRHTRTHKENEWRRLKEMLWSNL